MSANKPKDLYLANNLKHLELIALKQSEGKNIRRVDRMCQVADKIFLSIKEDPSDEEKTYVYMLRYMKLMENIEKETEDEVFVGNRFHRSLDWCHKQCQVIRNNLINRYNELTETPVPDNQAPDVADSNEPSTSVQPEPISDTEPFIPCQNLFNAKDTLKVLVVDTRPAEEFNASHMKNIDTVNVPEDYITPGLSANKLEKSLPDEIQEQFKTRDLYEVIVLTDWNSSSKKYLLSKVHLMNDILSKWEFNISYKYKPYILDGGYLAWIEKYPTLSTNPHIKYNREYSDLDELLDLDNIQYPTDITNLSITKILEEQNTSLSHTPTRDDLLNKLQKIGVKQLANERDLLTAQKRIFELNHLLQESKSTEVTISLNVDKTYVEEELSKLESLRIELDERKNKLTKEFSLVASFEPSDDLGIFKTKLKEIDKVEREIVQTFKIRKDLIISYKNAQEASMLEQEPSAPTGLTKIPKPVPVTPPTKPIIDRKRKPTTMNYLAGTLQNVTNGLTGLENIRNSCYMNTLIQCLRHIPEIMLLFCTGKYNTFVEGKKPFLTIEFAELVRSLWSDSHTVIRPTQFYKKICENGSIYSDGAHECVHIFFLFLLDKLHEDCGVIMDPEKHPGSKVTAWMMQFKGKMSFVLQKFYHQIKETQVCPKCGNKAVRFQCEPTLMLGVPDDRDFSLDEVLSEYFDKDTKFCTKCSLECTVKKVVSYCPPIISIVLKRYHRNGTDFLRNNHACHFKTENLRIGNQFYKLRAVAMHQGTLSSGHYTAACLNLKEDVWYEFNDSRVRPMNINDPMVKVKAYVLFYSVIEKVMN